MVARVLPAFLDLANNARKQLKLALLDKLMQVPFLQVDSHSKGTLVLVVLDTATQFEALLLPSTVSQVLPL